MNIKSHRVVDEVEVARLQNEATNWTATCTVCGAELTGTICQLKAHKHDK